MRSLFTRFEVTSTLGNIDPDGVVDDIADTCWQWVVDGEGVDHESLPESWEKGEFKINEHDSLMVDEQTCEDGRFWRMRRSEWARNDDGVEYVHHIFIVRDGKRIEFSLLQEIKNQRQRIGPAGFQVFPPSVIGQIMDDYDCKMEGEVMSQNWDLVSSARTKELVSDKILDPARVVPIVLLSKRRDTRQPIIERLGRLSSRLSGLARIYVLNEIGTKRFEAEFGRQWVGNGTIRIYWPGITQDRIAFDPAWEDMFSVRKFEDDFQSDEDSLSQAIIDRICDRTSTLSASSSLVKRVRKRLEDEETERLEKEEEGKREELLAEMKTIEEEATFYEGENKGLKSDLRKSELTIDQKEEEIDGLKDTEDSLRFQISSLKDKVFGLREVVDSLGAVKGIMEEALKRNPEGGLEEFREYVEAYYSDEDEPEPEPEFNSIADAVKEARRRLPKIRFLKTAISSSKETNSDADPAEVFEVFRHLNDELWEKIRHATKKDLLVGKNRLIISKELKDRHNRKFAEGESNATMNKFRNELNQDGRMFPLGDSTWIRMEPHIRLGSKSNPLRIHLRCLHEGSDYEAIERYTKSNGKLGKRVAKRAITHFPAILIGWCGDHLETISGK